MKSYYYLGEQRAYMMYLEWLHDTFTIYEG